MIVLIQTMPIAGIVAVKKCPLSTEGAFAFYILS